jgi:hypothetical protein
MARIPEHEIERLKTDISLVRLAEARGIKLKRSGDNLLGLCPFHADHQPSLVISEAKNLWHCLGACQAASPARPALRMDGCHCIAKLQTPAARPSADSDPRGRVRSAAPATNTCSLTQQ